jgi:nicotinate-nucleotide pyrophosphorylase (carboxylating)
MPRSVPKTTPDLWRFVSHSELARLIRTARAEDLGPRGRDITSELTVPRSTQVRALMRSRAAGRLCGGALLREVARVYHRSINVQIAMPDGTPLEPGSIVATFRGPLRAILAMERVALNFATHLSGIATMTARFAAVVAGTRAAICDTRKTHPGLRALEKYAVVCGGGQSHRFGLHDAILVKDNHLAQMRQAHLGAVLGKVLARVRHLTPAPLFVEVEVDTLEQLREVLTIARPARPDMVLLDNMTPHQMAQGVALRDQLAPGVLLEASGGITLHNVRAIAATGVDRISIGALTHSAPALDIGLDIK